MYVAEPGCSELAEVVVEGDGPTNTPCLGFRTAQFGRKFADGDDVGDHQPSSWP
jgi:hypothetical protein